jgi:hypothetical protein
MVQKAISYHLLATATAGIKPSKALQSETNRWAGLLDVDRKTGLLHLTHPHLADLGSEPGQ